MSRPPRTRPPGPRTEPTLSMPGAHVAGGRDGPHSEMERVPRLRSMREEGRASRRRRSWAGRLMMGLGLVLVGLLIAGGAFVLLANPSRLIEERIVAEIQARTGRTLSLQAPAAFTVLPHIGVRLSGVTLSAPPGMTAPPLVTARQLDVAVRLLPLLTREVAIDRLVLTGAVIELAVDTNGRRSWDFAAAGGDAARRPTRLAQVTSGPPTGPTAQPPALRGTRTDLPPELESFVQNATDPRAATAPTAGRRAAPGSTFSVDDLVLGDVRMVDSTVRYADLRSGQRHEVTAIDARLAMRSLGGPLDISGEGAWLGERISLESRIDTPRALLDGRPSQVVLNAAAAQATLAYEGTLAQREGPEITGRVALEAASALRLANAFGVRLPPAQGFGRALLKGQIALRNRKLNLDASNFALGLVSGSGTLAVDTTRPKPHVTARLSISELDVERFMAADATAAAEPPRAAWRPAGGGTGPRAPAQHSSQPSSSLPAAPAAPTSIEDLLRRDSGTFAPRVKGFTQRDGWSNEPIDVSALHLVDADARLVVAGLVTPKMATGRAQLRIALDGGNLRIDIDDLQLYQGRAKGFVTLAASEPPRLAANLQMDDVAVLPLLQAASGFDWLDGRGKVALAMAAAGRSERELVESLKGKTILNVHDGAILGFDVQERLRGLTAGRISGLSRVTGERTPFSEFAATFQTTSGVATTNDLRMTSPLVRMTGAGTIALPPREVDLLVRPRLTSGASAQPATAGASATPGFEVPVRIRGSWDKPSVTPDVNALLKDPNQVVDTIRQIGRNVDKKSLGDALNKILGGGEDGKAEKPSEALRNLFGGR